MAAPLGSECVPTIHLERVVVGAHEEWPVARLGRFTMNDSVSGWRDDRPLQSQLVSAAIFKLRERAQAAQMERATLDKLKLLGVVAVLATLAVLAV